jgi:hypothetical protein
VVEKDESIRTLGGNGPFHVITEYDPKPPVVAEFCQWADELSLFARRLIETLDETSPPVKFRQAKYLLTERYFEMRAKAPRNHRNNLGSNKHICLFSVYTEVYEYISTLQHRAIPPQIEVKNVPPPVPVPVVRQPSMSSIFGISDDWYPYEDTKDDPDKDAE